VPSCVQPRVCHFARYGLNPAERPLPPRPPVQFLLTSGCSPKNGSISLCEERYCESFSRLLFCYFLRTLSLFNGYWPVLGTDFSPPGKIWWCSRARYVQVKNAVSMACLLDCLLIWMVFEICTSITWNILTNCELACMCSWSYSRFREFVDSGGSRKEAARTADRRSMSADGRKLRDCRKSKLASFWYLVPSLVYARRRYEIGYLFWLPFTLSKIVTG